MSTSTKAEQQKPRIRLGPLASELALGQSELANADNLELAIRDLQTKNNTAEPSEIKSQIEKMATDLADMKSQVQTINESLLTIQTMIVALTAKKSEEIQSALEYINERVQTHQMLIAEMTELDTPRLSMLQDNLRKFQHRQMAEPDFEKEQSEPDREL